MSRDTVLVRLLPCCILPAIPYASICGWSGQCNRRRAREDSANSILSMTILGHVGTRVARTLTSFFSNCEKKAIVEGRRRCAVLSHACAKGSQEWLAHPSKRGEKQDQCLSYLPESSAGSSPSGRKNSPQKKKLS